MYTTLEGYYIMLTTHMGQRHAGTPAGPLWLPMPPVVQGKIQRKVPPRRHIAIHDCSQRSHTALGTSRDQLNRPILTTDTIEP